MMMATAETGLLLDALITAPCPCGCRVILFEWRRTRFGPALCAECRSRLKTIDPL
jgi:hypothetical protein